MDMQPVIESDDEIAGMLADPGTELVAVLPALAHALDDITFLPGELQPNTSNPFAEQGGWRPEQLECVRALALEGFGRLRDRNPPASPSAASPT